MSYYLGIDLGTSYFKAGVFDEYGILKGIGRQKLRKSDLGYNTCELPVYIFWETLQACIDESIRNAQISACDIVALSYSSQTNSFILLDNTDKPLTPLILWTDKRVVDIPASLSQLTERTDFTKKTGLGIKSGVTSMIAKIDWIQNNQLRIWSKVTSVMSISDYLTFVLTNQKVSDYSTSSMTGLFNVYEKCWWRDSIDIFGIREDQLSTPLKTGTPIGKISECGAKHTGLSQNTLLFLGGLDHHMVAIGAGLLQADCISESTGTVLACVEHQKGYRPEAFINVAPAIHDDCYFRLAFSPNGAVALEWYKTKYAPELTIPQLLSLAENVKSGCDGLIALPCANEYADLDGFQNVKAAHSRGHFVRAILESTALSLLQLQKILDISKANRPIVPSGGGAQSKLWLQIKADILNKVFLVPESAELACMGAAMLAFKGCNSSLSITEISEKWTRWENKIYPSQKHYRN